MLFSTISMGMQTYEENKRRKSVCMIKGIALSPDLQKMFHHLAVRVICCLYNPFGQRPIIAITRGKHRSIYRVAKQMFMINLLSCTSPSVRFPQPFLPPIITWWLSRIKRSSLFSFPDALRPFFYWQWLRYLYLYTCLHLCPRLAGIICVHVKFGNRQEVSR